MDRSKFAGSNDMMSMTAVMIWYSVTITEEDDTIQGTRSFSEGMSEKQVMQAD